MLGCGNLWLAGRRKDLDLRFEATAEFVAFNLQVVSRLEVEPKLFRGAEEACKPERGIRGDRARAMHNLIDPTGRHADAMREPILREPERFQKSREEDFARVNRGELLGRRASMVVDEFDLVRLAVDPLETCYRASRAQ